MLTIQQLKLSPDHSEQDIIDKIAKTLKVNKEAIRDYKIVKRSIDARKKDDIKVVYTVSFSTANEAQILKRCNPSIVMQSKESFYEFPKQGSLPLKKRPMIIGAGPAGLFCGLLLAEHGFEPLLLERGEAVEKRMQTVNTFWEKGILNLSSNVQFGEGGAGTFSDGKLNTLVKDPIGRNKKVLELLVEAGAPSEILYYNKPHIGTDVLVNVVKNIRKQIEAYGGTIHFESQVTDFTVRDGKVVSVTVNHTEQIDTDLVVLAIGHSARDTFASLEEKKVLMQAKAFAVGLRIEHPQFLINRSQYGEENPRFLPTADYKLTYQASTNRGVYSFCMCPGGYVVNASSEEKRLAVNGMSYSKRDGINANSAIIVTVSPYDFPGTSPLSGVAYQRKLEEAAYGLANGAVPVQLFHDFCQNQESRQIGEVEPQIKGNYQFANLREILPDYLSNTLIEGIQNFEHQIKGFGRPDAILSGVESRTSSPVRIVRDEFLESNIKGIYPCGEGAGYAGGITSAAMDGIKVAEAIAKKYKTTLE